LAEDRARLQEKEKREGEGIKRYSIFFHVATFWSAVGLLCSFSFRVIAWPGEAGRGGKAGNDRLIAGQISSKGGRGGRKPSFGEAIW